MFVINSSLKKGYSVETKFLCNFPIIGGGYNRVFEFGNGQSNDNIVFGLQGEFNKLLLFILKITIILYAGTSTSMYYEVYYIYLSCCFLRLFFDIRTWSIIPAVCSGSVYIWNNSKCYAFSQQKYLYPWKISFYTIHVISLMVNLLF